MYEPCRGGRGKGGLLFRRFPKQVDGIDSYAKNYSTSGKIESGDNFKGFSSIAFSAQLLSQSPHPRQSVESNRIVFETGRFPSDFALETEKA